MNRGQSLLETTLALAVLLFALGAATAAFRATAQTEHPETVRLVAYSEVSDAATELVAATAYDPMALTKIQAASWSVMPPAPPSPAPTGAAGPVTLSAKTEVYGESREVKLHGVAGPAHVDAALSLRYAAPPPGAIVQGEGPGGL